MKILWKNTTRYVANKRPLLLVGRVLVSMKRDDLGHLAAGFAYYALFSVFPLLIGFLAIIGLFVESNTLQRDFLTFVSNNLPGSGPFVTENLLNIVEIRGVLSFSAIVIALFLGRSVFAAISRSINRASGLRRDRPFYIAIPIQLGLIIPIGSLFILSNAVTAIFELFGDQTIGPQELGWLANIGLRYLTPLVITLFVFTMLYRFVPNRSMRWKWIWPGAVVSTILFELVKNAFVWYVETVPTYTQLYGALTSVIVLMLWAYISGLILMFGARINYEYENLYFPNTQ